MIVALVVLLAACLAWVIWKWGAAAKSWSAGTADRMAVITAQAAEIERLKAQLTGYEAVKLLNKDFGFAQAELNRLLQAAERKASDLEVAAVELRRQLAVQQEAATVQINIEKDRIRAGSTEVARLFADLKQAEAKREEAERKLDLTSTSRSAGADVDATRAALDSCPRFNRAARSVESIEKFVADTNIAVHRLDKYLRKKAAPKRKKA